MKLLAPLLLLISLPFISAVKEHDFKKCNQSGFCRRGRALASRAEEAGPKKWKSPYTLDSSTVSYSNNKSILKARVKSSLYPDIKFELEVRIHKDGVVRIRMDEVGGLKQRYNEAASWALIKEPELKSSVSWKSAADGREIVASYDNGLQLRITSDPLVITLFRGGKEEIVLNGRGLFHMEHFRTKDVPAPEDVEEQKVTDEGSDQTVISAETKIKETAWFEGDSEDAYWEESFGTWTDSKPKGAFV
jgi:alpha 1,3-glucosidase